MKGGIFDVLQIKLLAKNSTNFEKFMTEAVTCK